METFGNIAEYMRWEGNVSSGEQHNVSGCLLGCQGAGWKFLKSLADYYLTAVVAGYARGAIGTPSVCHNHFVGRVRLTAEAFQ